MYIKNKINPNTTKLQKLQFNFKIFIHVIISVIFFLLYLV
jgi:hypothetical protein